MLKNVFPGPERIANDNIILGSTIRRVMTTFWIWSRGERDMWYYIRVFIFYAYATFAVSGVAASIYYYTNKYGYIFETTSDAVSGLLLFFWMCFSTVYFLNKQNIFETLLNDLGDFTEYEKPSGIEELDTNLSILSAAVVCFIWISVFFVTLWYLIIHCEDHVEDYCGMIVTYWFPIKDFFTRWNRRWSLLIQISVVSITCAPAFFGPWSMLSVSEYIVNRIDHLIRMIELVPKLKTRKIRNMQLAKCINYHQKILEFTDRLTKNSYKFLLVHVPYTTFMLTLISIQLITKIKFLDIVNCVLWLFFITMCCTFGERLLSKSIAISEACYLNMPFDGDLKTQRDLLFMILTNKKLCLTAGMNEQCNHQKLVEVLKTTYSFITLLGKLGWDE